MIGIVILFLLGIDLYVFQGVKVLITDLSSGRLLIFLKYLYWTLSITIPVIFFYSVIHGRTTHQISGFGIGLGNFWLVLLVTKLVFLLFLFGEDIYRISMGIYNRISENYVSTESNTYIPSRRKFISQVAIGVAALPFASLIYGIVLGRYNYKIHKVVMHFKDLPDAFDGFTITQVSDIHSGSFDGREGVIKGIRMIQELKSDLLVFTGDLVNTFSEEFDPWIDDFKTLTAKYGQYSILGNHDYGDYTEWKSLEEKEANFIRTKGHHQSMGFKLMLDESERIEKDGQYIQLLGVENWGKGFGERGNLAKAISKTEHNDFKILMSHDPTHWEFQVKDYPIPIHLTLSGHTHGMQMGVELPGFRWSPAQYRYPKWAGLYEEKNSKLYINRGFGVLGFRGRAGIWPEITQIELRKEA
ncbi:MAG: metallophosphoesterase [Saprospiraceae bacterium]